MTFSVHIWPPRGGGSEKKETVEGDVATANVESDRVKQGWKRAVAAANAQIGAASELEPAAKPDAPNSTVS